MENSGSWNSRNADCENGQQKHAAQRIKEVLINGTQENSLSTGSCFGIVTTSQQCRPMARRNLPLSSAQHYRSPVSLHQRAKNRCTGMNSGKKQSMPKSGIDVGGTKYLVDIKCTTTRAILLHQ